MSKNTRKDFVKQHRPIKVLLVPDQHNWAFDNIASAIIKYNPYPYAIQYTKLFIADHPIINPDEWDYIYVMFEAERYIPSNKQKLVRGCYSSLWLEHYAYSPQFFGELFSQSRAAIFVNDNLANAIVPFLTIDTPWTVIYDSSDETVFYPIAGQKQNHLTALFVGNTSRPIKRFNDIELICREADVELLVARNVPRHQLVFLYNKADVCINFSVAEGGPQTFAEAALCEVPMLICSDNALTKHIPCFIGQTQQDFVDILTRLKYNRNKCIEKGQLARRAVLQNFTYKHAAKKFADFFLLLWQQDNQGS